VGDFDGLHVIANCCGRQKDKNMKHNLWLAGAATPKPLRYLEIRGRVAEITGKGASEHIDKMAQNTWVWMGIPPGPAISVRQN
jgi:hypothetical protein